MSAGSRRGAALCSKTANQGGESFGVKAVEFLQMFFLCAHTSFLFVSFIKANQISFQNPFRKLNPVHVHTSFFYQHIKISLVFSLTIVSIAGKKRRAPEMQISASPCFKIRRAAI